MAIPSQRSTHSQALVDALGDDLEKKLSLVSFSLTHRNRGGVHSLTRFFFNLGLNFGVHRSQKKDISAIIKRLKEKSSELQTVDAKNIEEKTKQRKAIQSFFFEILSQARPEEFNRSDVEACKTLLSDELALCEMSKTPPQATDYKIAELRLAENLGSTPVKNKGARGSYIYHSIDRKKAGCGGYVEMGLFKAREGGVSLLHRMTHAVGRALGFRYQNDLLAGKSYTNSPDLEVAASLADEHWKLGMVPKTVCFKTKKGQEGSLQIWQHGYYEAQAKMKAINKCEDKAQTELQKLMLFNYLMGDLDGKPDNWLVRGPKGEGSLFAKIDNGNILPTENASKSLRNKIATRNQYLWTEHKFAKKALSSDAIAFAKTFTDESIDEYFKKIARETQGRLADSNMLNMRKAMKERRDALLGLISQGNMRLRDCSKIKYDEDIKAVIVKTQLNQTSQVA